LASATGRPDLLTSKVYRMHSDRIWSAQQPIRTSRILVSKGNSVSLTLGSARREREDLTSTRSLAHFTGRGYTKGRTKFWQIAWIAASQLIFMKWWMPPPLRPILLRLFGAKIGRNVLIRHNVRIHWPWKLTLGDNCWIGEGAWLLNLEPITVGNDVCISQEALLCTGSHKSNDPAFEFDNGEIVVAPGAWLAARSIVLRGARVEADEVVAAGAIRHQSRNRHTTLGLK
jgi:putative colanic acid biosynthesis acetyltransferase WcaF